jgi:hypothetical protein
MVNYVPPKLLLSIFKKKSRALDGGTWQELRGLEAIPLGNRFQSLL